MAARTQPRDAQTGRYGFEGQWDRLCVCGHRLGVHTADAPHECMVRDFDKTAAPCDCMKFRPSRKRA
ncbi:MAG TPA: hypothetical protein VEA38_03605 [Terriglobales bacterium]|nr:hypothetical protein [Terriglobales bacterium]